MAIVWQSITQVQDVLMLQVFVDMTGDMTDISIA